jgi:hypothetical protein
MLRIGKSPSLPSTQLRPSAVEPQAVRATRCQDVVPAARPVRAAFQQAEPTTSDRPHWKDPAYKAWAAVTYSTEDYAPHQRHPCWKDADFYAEFAAEEYGAENYHLFDPNKPRTEMSDAEIMEEARARAHLIIHGR